MVVKVRWTIELDVEVRDRTYGEALFYIEENLCYDNLVEDLWEEMKTNPRVCQTCHRSTAELLTPEGDFPKSSD